VPLPISDRASREALSLPMFAELPETDVARVVEAVRGFYR
jgi:dTDP-4-amino-4,6-dideoxygalactose transaminase